MKYLWDQDKYGTEESTSISKAFHHSLRSLVRDRFESSGVKWEDFVFGNTNCSLTETDFSNVEAKLLAIGHRFDVSAIISAKEAPGKYKALTGQNELKIDSTITDGRMRVGQGDNVVNYPKSVTGVALYVHTTEEVMTMMMEGVPPDSIAIIDDSGGTLTAPILEHFKAVICMGGTVRSHLGILCREYGIPCLMNAKVGGISNGDRLEVNYAASAKSAQDYQKSVEKFAEIWKLV